MSRRRTVSLHAPQSLRDLDFDILPGDGDKSWLGAMLIGGWLVLVGAALVWSLWR